MLPVVLCAIIKKFFCLFKGKALAVFKNEVLVRTFGPKEAAWSCKALHNEELYKLHSWTIKG